MEKVLVTGGAGLQGSRLVNKLLEKDLHVSVADNYSRGSKNNLFSVFSTLSHIHVVDLRNYESCVEITKGVDTVFHLAASLGGVEWTHGSKDMASHGASMASDNLLMDTNILRASVKNDVEKLLFPSTACIYPTQLQEHPDSKPLKEEWAYPANPESPYGWAKLMSEILCKSYAEEIGIKIAIVRLFNVYGEGESVKEGSHVVPELIRKALKYPDAPFVVYGDGTQTRAFTYVDDAVDALILAMEKYAVADPVNVGSDESVSIRVLAEKILKLANKNAKIEFDESKPVGVLGRCADISKAKRVLDWQPKTSLDEGLRKTVEWYLKEGK